MPDANLHDTPRQAEEMSRALSQPDGCNMFSRSPKQLEQMIKGNGKGQQAQFYLIRHGATPMNAGTGSIDRIRGWRNVPLSPQGHKEADKLGARLKGSGIKLLVHSDLD